MKNKFTIEGSELRKLLETNNITQEEIANLIGVTRATVGRWINKTGLDRSKWLAIEEAINKKKGITQVDSYQKQITKMELNALDEKKGSYKTIPFIDQKVFATISPAMSDVITMKPETFIKIPIFSQGEYALEVSGNSMHPYIRHGDWIVVKEVLNKNFIIYGECYLVLTKSDNFKTVAFLNEVDYDEKVLYLSKYNTEQFKGQTIPKEEIYKLYKVIGKFGKV